MWKPSRESLLKVLGVALIAGGLISLSIVEYQHWSNEAEKASLLDQSENFVLLNDTQNVGVATGETALEDSEDSKVYKEDVISVLTEDQKVTDKGVATVEIPEISVKAPILEGTSNDVLAKAAGHFEGTGEIGKGNYCIAGHSSSKYACIFNNLKNVKIGMQIDLTDADGKCYTYYVTENFVVEPDEVGVLDEMYDNRITIVTCTDGGLRRQIVVGLKMTEDEYKEYTRSQSINKRMNIVNLASKYANVEVSNYFEEASSK